MGLGISNTVISDVAFAAPNSRSSSGSKSAGSKSAVLMPSMVAPIVTEKPTTKLSYKPFQKVSYDELSFSYRFESFLNREKPPAGVPDYQEIGAHFRTESTGKVFRGTLELGGSFATSVENYSNFYVPEAFLELETENFKEAETHGELRAKLSVGRKLEMWSLLDRNWGLGLAEPLNRFDMIRPIDQGLTGAFVEGGGKNFKFVAFASGVFIPEQGPTYSLQNGRLKSVSPWFVEPTDRLILFSESTEVQYDIQTPSVGSVINQTSGGLLLRYGKVNDGFYSQLSYLFKPRNQLATPFEGSLNLTDTTSYAFVQIHPQVLFHQLVAGDIGYGHISSQNDYSYAFGVSYLADIPVNTGPLGEDLTYEELQPLMFVSPKISVGFATSLADYEFSVSYLHSEDRGFVMKGPFASDKAVFGARVPYKEAVAVDGRMVVGRGRRSTFSMGGRWLEELAEKGSMLQADASLDFSMNGMTQDWRLSLMGDVLGSRLPSNENQGYVSRYRGHDRWMSELRFLF